MYVVLVILVTKLNSEGKYFEYTSIIDLRIVIILINCDMPELPDVTGLTVKSIEISGT